MFKLIHWAKATNFQIFSVFPQIVSIETSVFMGPKIGKLLKEIHYFMFQTAIMTKC